MSCDLPAPIERLRAVTVELLSANAAVLSLDAAEIQSIRRRGPVEPARLPVLSLLDAMRGRAGAGTAEVVDAIIDAADHLAWRQTYREEDGFDRSYLDRYGWFDIAGPEGPYQADGIRIMAGYWGQGLRYPDHSHPPEEHYLVLAGGARFRLGDNAWRPLGPGEIFHTPAGAIHSADMGEEALMAISIWRAPDLSVRINLTDSDRDVVLPPG